MTALTKKQHELLTFIREHQAKHEQSPTFDEMREAMGLQSKSGIHRLISGLQERGYIRRLPYRARALEIVPDPHLPTPSDLARCTLQDLSREVRRRGLVLGEYWLDDVRTGQVRKTIRRFHEIAA
jgi:SOS-response transcriptional repressor LexA